MRPVDVSLVSSSRRWRRAVAVGVALTALGACSHDGRSMREAGPDQTLSIVTTTVAATTTVADGFETGALPSIAVETTPSAPSTAASTTAAPGSTAVIDSGPLDGFRITAPWAAGGMIDARYTCAGDDAAPSLAWADVPPDAAELALVVVDPDAGNYVHWVVAGISPGVTAIADGQLPAGAVQGTNGSGTVGWTGPCPPAGQTHTYRFEIHALGAPSGLTDGADGQEMLRAIDVASLEQATVLGVFRGG